MGDVMLSLFILQRTEENWFYSLYDFKRKQDSKLFLPVVLIWWVVCRNCICLCHASCVLTHWLIL